VLTVNADIDQEALKQAALADERVAKYVDGKPVKRIIVTETKLVNIIVA